MPFRWLFVAVIKGVDYNAGQHTDTHELTPPFDSMRILTPFTGTHQRLCIMRRPSGTHLDACVRPRQAGAPAIPRRDPQRIHRRQVPVQRLHAINNNKAAITCLLRAAAAYHGT